QLERARRLTALGADYLAFGSVYPSPTKPAARRADLQLLAMARRELELPIVAIGGITPANAPPLVAAGVDLLAVISSLWAAPDIRAAARAYQALYQT
ncbi:MAG: thiamine phosphate synthase, partial [Candidatus Competibacteraceae bacterium]|nr:thiamine phosphate synthase [Candidatus Competibacteraceae bacterium]